MIQGGDPRAEAPALVVFCACPSPEVAAALGRALVERRVAACAQVLTVPIRSIYRWQGRLCDEPETLLLLKSVPAAWERLRQAVAELHPYDVPELLACPAEGTAGYLAWLAEGCAPGEPTPPGQPGAAGGRP